MKKQTRKCKDCAICKIKEDLALCTFGGGEPSVVFPENKACKMASIPSTKPAKKEPQPGEAPFCGDFAKCNDAEGCDACLEFADWAEAEQCKK